MDITGGRDITGGVTFTGLTTAPTGAHIHRLDGSIAISLVQAANNATATIPADTKLSDTDYAQLLAGYLYFNVHSSGTTGGCAPPANCANGEIRGQITGTTGVTAGRATLDGTQEVPPSTSTATGRGTIVFDSTPGPTFGDILICYVTHNVTNTTNAHIHTQAPGVSGGVSVPLFPQTANIQSPVVPATLTQQNVTDLTAGNTYFNVHSSNPLCPNAPAGAPSCSGGEIRGQIAVQ
jgi:hypothetical protein